jgi:hypothetical protein
MDYRTLCQIVDTRAQVRITERSGYHKGTVGIALGYNAQYHTVKVGFIDADGNYTGDYTKVSVDCLELHVPAEAEQAQPEAGLGVVLARVSAGLDELLAETEAAIPAPITDRHGVTWTWKAGDIFRDGSGRAWPRKFIDLG